MNWKIVSSSIWLDKNFLRRLNLRVKGRSALKLRTSSFEKWTSKIKRSSTWSYWRQPTGSRITYWLTERLSFSISSNSSMTQSWTRHTCSSTITKWRAWLKVTCKGHLHQLNFLKGIRTTLWIRMVGSQTQLAICLRTSRASTPRNHAALSAREACLASAKTCFTK